MVQPPFLKQLDGYPKLLKNKISDEKKKKHLGITINIP